MRKLVLLVTTVFTLSTAIAQITESDVNLAKQMVAKNSTSIGISPADISNSIVASTYMTKENLRMVYLQQSYKNIPVYNQLYVLAFRNDKAVSIAGGRLPKIAAIVNSPDGVPFVSAEQAAMVGLTESNIAVTSIPSFKEIRSANGSRKFDFGNLGVTYENITAELVWMPVAEKEVKLSWLVLVAPNGSDACWLITIDALNGSIIGKRDLTQYDELGHRDDQAQPDYINYVSQRIIPKPDFEFKTPLVNSASYLVIKYPAESPQHTGGTAVVHTDPWTMAPGNATTLKWHSTGTNDYTITRGNNVFATEDRAATNVNTGLPATSSTPDPLTFNFPPDYTFAPTLPGFQQFAITNLFYWNNILHDLTYVYGFDEASANFQVNNQGRGGIGNDDVSALAQSGAGTNNANFLTLADGQRGRMRMYLFTAPNPDRDGDLDNGIMCHEFGHGISTRMTGGGNASCLGQLENQGEGWGDYMALMLTTNWATATVTDGANVPRAMGTYAVGQTTAGSGIRNYKYCTNIAVNPLTYAHMGINGAPWVLSGGGNEVHNYGEIWCMALWEMTWEIIQTAGINPNLFNPAAGGGNAIAFKLMVEGMRLQPCNPGYIDARNAILKADTLFFGGQYSCAIWTAFAKRGMGRGAAQGSSNSLTDQTISFIISSAQNTVTENVVTQQEGSNVTYTTKVTADGCGAITNYFVTDTLPDNVTHVSGGTYNSGNRTVTFSPINLASGASQTYPFTVSINNGTYFTPVTHFNEAVTGTTIPAAWTPTVTVGSSTWVVSTSSSHSAPNSLATLYNEGVANDLSLATTAQFNIQPTTSSNYTTLSFWHRYNTEEGWDGGVVEISTNNGSTWSDVGSRFVKNGYNTSLGTGSNLAGRNAFTGTTAGFIQSIVNLSSFAGQNIKIRFRFASDNNTGAASGTSGWWIDDIVLYTEPAVQIRSNLFNASNVRQSYADTVTKITAGCTTTTITTQPSNANGCIGGSTTFSVVASGTPTYQWQINTGSGFTDITNNATYSGATTATLTVSNISAAMSTHLFRVVISNTCTPAFNSNSASLSVGAVATLNSSPSNVSACAGATVTFSVGATSATSFQWQVNTGSGFVNIGNTPPYSGATTSTLTITGITAGMNNNQYRAIIGSCPSNINSNAATLQITTQVAITAQPQSVTVCVGQNTSFSVTVSGTPTSYQWELSTDGGSTYSNIPGANSSSISLTAVTLAQNGHRYRVKITDACGNITSAVAILTVNPAPAFTIGTLPATACTSDGPITLTTTPGGTVWTGNGVSSPTTGTYIFTPLSAGAGTHTLTATLTTGGCSTSHTAVIQVNQCANIHLLLSDVKSTSIYPVPGDGNITIRINTDLYKKLGVKVFDSHGRQVRSYLINPISYGVTKQINLTALEDGVYHLYLYNDENGFIERGISILIHN